MGLVYCMLNVALHCLALSCLDLSCLDLSCLDTSKNAEKRSLWLDFRRKQSRSCSCKKNSASNRIKANKLAANKHRRGVASKRRVFSVFLKFQCRRILTDWFEILPKYGLQSVNRIFCFCFRTRVISFLAKGNSKITSGHSRRTTLTLNTFKTDGTASFFICASQN